MPEILAKLDRHPKRISGDKALYLSPLRNEKTPSFWVYLKTNTWYDYGEAAGGDLIDFVRHYLKSNREDHTTADALRWIKNMSVHSGISPMQFNHVDLVETDPVLSIRSVKPLKHPALINYLKSRGINENIAAEHLQQVLVNNKATGKTFYALGFKNEEGGYELHNSFFKGSTKPKTISFVRAKKYPANRVHLFEGFTDYLSAVSRFGIEYLDGDSIILNSVVCLSRAFPYIQNYGYKIANSWLDNDRAGENAGRLFSEFLKTQQDIQHVRMNNLYAPYKDVNEWHVASISNPAKAFPKG
ncbi:CHC2 zinc finger domain-containing protein [Dyadobacter sp. CY323]|nr:CHC2 zinc finger domain-containing protein [Dyadobacter sp. CY323]